MAQAGRTIRIAAALIADRRGHLLLVRKAGTAWFMQAGGKIEPGETALAALRRELREEVGIAISDEDTRYLGRFYAPAANEPDCIVEAEVFAVRIADTPLPGAEIAELLWLEPALPGSVPLAPLTRDHLVPLAHIADVAGLSLRAPILRS